MSRRRPFVAVLLAAGTLAGCADHSSTTERNGTVALTLEEFRISPQNVSAQTGAVTFVVRNDGILAHDLRVEQGTHVLGGTTTIPPGATQRKTMHLPQGDYRIFSSLRRDDALGQYGKLTVR